MMSLKKAPIVFLLLIGLSTVILASQPLQFLGATDKDTNIEQYPDEREIDVTDFMQSAVSENKFTPEKDGFSVERIKISLDEYIMEGEAFQNANILEQVNKDFIKIASSTN